MAREPLRATVPFQLQRRARAQLIGAASAEKTRAQLQPQTQTEIRRTLSLDAIVGPCLYGHWPREGDRQCQRGHSQKDNFTQTSSWWPDEAVRRDTGGHKRSASWGNVEQPLDIAKMKQLHWSKPGVHNKLHNTPQASVQSQPVSVPLMSLPSTLRQSEERLDQELERAFKRHSPAQHSRLLEIPDGRRAPVPSRSSSCNSQNETVTRPMSSSCSSPCASPQSLLDLDTDLSSSIPPSCPSPLLGGECDASLSLLSSSPRPNKTYCFQREPPEGAERVRVCEENIFLCKEQSRLTSRPDPNKINFTPHGGSAFCPVSLLKPLLPSVDFLFRSLTVSPGSCWAGQGGVCQPLNPAVVTAGCLGSLEPATTAM